MALDNESPFEVLSTPLNASWSFFTSSNKCLLRRPFRVALRQCACLVVDFQGKIQLPRRERYLHTAQVSNEAGNQSQRVRRAPTVGFVSQERDKIGHINRKGDGGERG